MEWSLAAKAVIISGASNASGEANSCELGKQELDESLYELVSQETRSAWIQLESRDGLFLILGGVILHLVDLEKKRRESLRWEVFPWRIGTNELQD